MSSYNKPITFLCLLMRLEIHLQQEECVFPALTLFPPCCIRSHFLFLKQASHHREVKKPCHLVVNGSYYATKQKPHNRLEILWRSLGEELQLQ